VTQRARSTLSDVVSQFAEELGELPRLGEFLEILGLAVPSNNPAGGELPMPLTLKAKTAGNRVYRDASSSRVGELNDATFVEAVEALGSLAEQVAASTGQPASADGLAGAIHRAIRDESLRFADIDSEAITSVTVDGPKRRVKAQPGDVIAIPVDGGYRLAVMITRDGRGMALGLFSGAMATPRAGALDPASAKRYPVYTGEHLVADGTWPVVGHDEGLLAAFPSEPEIYHSPDPAWSGIGEFGSAETADDVMRDISEAEAREVGLLDGTYSQVYLEEILQARLTDGVL
jgi:hypothetical protein